MTRIRHTRERAAHYRFGDVHERFVEFAPDARVTDVDAADAIWAVRRFDDVEFAADVLPLDYDTLRSAASIADDDETDGVDGNSDMLTLMDWFDALDDDRRDELYDEVEGGDG